MTIHATIKPRAHIIGLALILAALILLAAPPARASTANDAALQNVTTATQLIMAQDATAPQPLLTIIDSRQFAPPAQDDTTDLSSSAIAALGIVGLGSTLVGIAIGFGIGWRIGQRGNK